jgi:hypothetical protein
LRSPHRDLQTKYQKSVLPDFSTLLKILHANNGKEISDLDVENSKYFVKIWKFHWKITQFFFQLNFVAFLRFYVNIKTNEVQLKILLKLNVCQIDPNLIEEDGLKFLPHIQPLALQLNII